MLDKWFKNDSKSAFAYIITTFSLISIFGTSIVYLEKSQNKDIAAEKIFNATLPLYGTWIGTLLAYYFAKENFDSATKNTRDILQSTKTDKSDNLDTILVSAAISKNSFLENDTSKLIEDIKKILIEKNRRRLPIIEINGTLKFLAYFEDLEAYNIKNPGKKIIDFIQASSDKNKAVAFVSKDITLKVANEERKKTPDCRDIIVTDNGKKDGKVIGYLTDSDIDQYQALV